jgi:hypothetical protein
MKATIIELLNNFDNDNLTQYQKENGSLNQSTQAKVTHAIIGAIEYQIKSQNNYIGNTLTDNLTKAVTSSNTTDTHEDYINSLNQQMTNAEQCVAEMEEFVSELKAIYKDNVGDDYRPYTSADKKLLGKQMATASRLEGLEKLKSRGITVEVPALDEVLGK